MKLRADRTVDFRRFLCILLVLAAMPAGIGWGAVSEADSIRKEVVVCKADSDKVAVLQRMFRRYKDSDLERADFYSCWMYESLKHSDDHQVLRTIHFSRGESLLNLEGYDSAIVFYTKALAFSDELGKAQCYYRLGKANDRLGNQNLALKQLRIANAYFTDVKSYKNIHGTYDLMMAIHARNGDYDSAIGCIQKKLELDRSRNSAIKEMEDHISVATLYGQQNKFNLAFEHVSDALEIAERTKSGYAEIYRSIGDLFFQKKNTGIALMYYNKALDQFTTRRQDDVLADTYNCLGRLHLEEGRLVEALQQITNALTIAKRAGYRHQLADAYHLLGRYYQKVGRWEAAMTNLRLCFQTGCNVCSRLAFFDVMVEMGDLYVRQGGPDSAKEWYLKSLQLAETFQSQREMSVAKQRLGSWYLAQGKSMEAERYFLQSVRDARASKQPSTMKSVADLLSSFYARKGDFKQAFTYERWSNALGDSISKMDGKASMAALEMNFEFENLRKANEARQLLALEEIKRQKQFRNFLFIIVGLLLLVGAMMLYGYRKKMRDNRLLLAQKRQIEDNNRAILEQVAEIKTQKEEIERISAKLHETDLLKLRFFSNISHEIRTPLTLILHPLKAFMKAFEGDAAQQHQLQLIYDNTVRLHELTNQILDLQKLDSGRLELHPSTGDVVAHLSNVLALFEGYCNDFGCRMVFDSPHASVFCSFDADKLSKMLCNVLSNAFKYNKRGGEVFLRLAFDDSNLTMTVQDSGVGIPASSLQTVFTRYYQVDGSNLPYEGTGIGLAYVKELTELMHGSIELISEVGSGTSVSITIPVGAVRIDRSELMHTECLPAQTHPSAEVPDLESDEVFTRTLLVVEDHPDLRKLIGGLFESSCRVVYASNGQEGLEQALRFIPDLVICDVMMPVMNGLELSTALKKEERTCHIPILLLTAKDSHEDHVMGYRSGADDYVVKPFDSEILLLKVQNMLDTREAMKKQFSLDQWSDKSPSSMNPLDEAFLQKCTSVIKEHLDDPDFSIDALMDHLALGRRSLFRKMKALTNMSPYEFVTAYRLKQAVGFLKQGMRVSEVAYGVGFANPQSFSVAFKKQFGVSPSEFKG